MQTKKLQTIIPKLTIYLPIAIGITLLTFLTFSSQAQTWQWGVRGGSADFLQNYDETVVDMATDPAGNIYEISLVGQTALNVDGHAKTNYGNLDILLSSFTCNGAYRWSKDIGGFSNDNAVALKTDSLGGVYVTGTINLNSLTPNGHIDTDTTLSDYTKKQLFLLKFDTAGTYKWLVMPQADTIGLASLENTGPIDMDVDVAGNIYWMCWLAPGAYDNGAYVITTQGAYMLKYDKNGFFQSNTQMSITATSAAPYSMRLKRSNTGKYFIAGYLDLGSLTLGSQPITQTMYVSAFSSTGQALWVKQNANVTSQLLGRQALDVNNDIYITGAIQGDDTMCSFSLTGGPFAMAIDSNGNGIWAKCATVNASCGGEAVTMKNNDEVVISGEYPGYVAWPSYSSVLNLPPNSGYDVFVTRFNAHTGQVLGLDSIASDFGENEFPAAMTADSKGNVYIGGQFQSQMYIANDTLQSIGGETDFFVAKYGFANCTCTATPTANYSYATAGGGIVNFTYTGATPYDSLQWSFGDGSTAATANPSHTYTTSTGTYYACVTVFNSCGSGTYCDTVRPGLGVLPVNGMDNISVYPNPGSDAIYIKGLTGQTDYVMQNTIGVTVSRGILTPASNVIGMQGLAPGVYLLQLTDKDGQQKVIRLVKE